MSDNQADVDLMIPPHVTNASLEELAERYYPDGDLTRKSPTYLASYRRLFDGNRRNRLRILELGVSSGASLLMWRDYLPYATIVGLDVAEPPDAIRDQDRIHFVQGSQDDPDVLEQAARIIDGTFDVIIDDASHIGYLTKRSLEYLFPRHLAAGGCYVIEDFGTGFMEDYPDGRRFVEPDWNDAIEGNASFRSSQFGMVGVIKQLVEPLMQELATRSAPYLAISRLTIETNIAFIEKSHNPAPPAPALPQGRRAWPTHDTPDTSLSGSGLSRVENIEERLRGLEQLPDRVGRLEVQMDMLRKSLAPSRLFRHFGRNVRR